MYLKKLELVGFKSFYIKTILHFEPGITAIVGPNGCGKSNCFDGIRWVLGEQSVKALRGSEMLDVIFNGTDLKEPLSMAEVTLTFDNAQKFFSVDNDEVAITRRIFRSGESEYLLNKAPVRLKDILDLLMGTGIGAESYSLVAQGKIDLILSSRPEDRRLVFDEAAGITKYKAQKKEALRKLEETAQNLLRVNDIIAEVKRQIGSLERQANKARRYKEVFEELKAKEIDLAALQKKALLKSKDELIKQLSELEAAELILVNKIKQQEASIANRQIELKALEEATLGLKNKILNSDNLIIRNKEHILFNQQRLKELETTRHNLEGQGKQVKNQLLLDEEKLNSLKSEYAGIRQNIREKTGILQQKEAELSRLAAAIKSSLEKITQTKKEILEMAAKIANARNEISDLSSRQQIYLARQRRLEIEKSKADEERALIEGNLKNMGQEVEDVSRLVQDLNQKINNLNDKSSQEKNALNNLNSRIENLEKQKLTLESHREFIEKLKSKYEDISEALNATVYLDKMPQEKVTGLVVKITSLGDAPNKLLGEAKPLDLDTQKMIQKLAQIQQEIENLNQQKKEREAHLQELGNLIGAAEGELRQQDIALAHKKTNYAAISEQFNKVKAEAEIISLELTEVEEELCGVKEKINSSQSVLEELERTDQQQEELIANEQNSIASNTGRKETVLVEIAQIKTGIEGLNKQISSDEATLKILEGAYKLDQDSLLNIERQMQETQGNKKTLAEEIIHCENKISGELKTIEIQKGLLQEREAAYQVISDGAQGAVAAIDAGRRELDGIKDKLYKLQMENKDLDFKFLSIKERILNSYKVDLEMLQGSAGDIDQVDIAREIQALKEKLDSYGSVNLIAIEEYDELKKRYDFLTQQQNDLVSAKDSLHEAILKINRTTKKMFLETFEKVRGEFRNYFKLLFNGGDAQIFLIDEQDPLESGIEIICRPPGKKLQNVFLLSGGEKALSAIALIFAIFKIKPSPFCVLDEIDAALDEANVDRFGRLLQEFTRESQFIVITHNKRTIANANVMYGITMEESGVSKIVSVKFAQDEPLAAQEPDASAVAESV